LENWDRLSKPNLSQNWSMSQKSSNLTETWPTCWVGWKEVAAWLRRW
jgi:hypothetical protein